MTDNQGSIPPDGPCSGPFCDLTLRDSALRCRRVPHVSIPDQADRRDGRYLSLDLWRGLACLLLVLYHSAFYVPAPFIPRDPGTWSVGSAAVKAAQLGWVGVPIFFVVSGYCIAASVNSLRRKDGSVRTFF